MKKMTSQIYYLHRGKTNFIRVDSEDNWAKIVVYKNDEKLGEILGKENLVIGKPFGSSAGEIVFIRLKRPFLRKPRISVLINGNTYYHKQHLNSPLDRIKRVNLEFLFIAVASLFPSVGICPAGIVIPPL